MRPWSKIFFTAMLISFMGELPLGTINVAAMQITVSDGIVSAVLFSLGSFLPELIYVCLTLAAMEWIRKQKKLFRIFEYITVLVLLTLAAFSFNAALHAEVQKNIVLSSSLPKFLLGFSMCALSPGPIPFWFGWTTILLERKVLLPRRDHYKVYVAGIGLGTLLGNCLYIFGGLLIAKYINGNQHFIHWFIGSVFLVTAIIYIWRILQKKDAVQKIAEQEKEGKAIG
jgi:threonine/homoserine/homoserine lactone efflux protein